MTGCPLRDGPTRSSNGHVRTAKDPHAVQAWMIPALRLLPLPFFFFFFFFPFLFPETFLSSLVLFPSRRIPSPIIHVHGSLTRWAAAPGRLFRPRVATGENLSSARLDPVLQWEPGNIGRNRFPRLASFTHRRPPASRPDHPGLHQPSIARVRQASSRAVRILADGAGTKGAAVHLLVP